MPLICQKLIQLCTENVYNDNIFHLLGLQTTATSRQIRRRREDLESAHEMGEEAWKREFKHLLGNRPVPSFEDVQVTFEHLADPEYRIVSEFFWMWPIEDDDAALKELLEGNRSAAIRIWEQAAVGFGKKRSIAQHNLAIVYQFYAIDAELQAIDVAEVPDDFHRQMCDYWTQSFSYWEDLADSDDFWNIFKARMYEFDDPRLTHDFVCALRKQFPVAFDAINLRLAVEYAKRDKFFEAKRHIDYMLKTMVGPDNIEETLRCFFVPMSKKIDSLIKSYNERVKLNPAEGLNVANELIDATERDYGVVYGLFGGDSPTAGLYAAKKRRQKIQSDPRYMPSANEINELLSEERNQVALLNMRGSLYDPVVNACFNYLFKYSEATKDWKITIEWDDFLGKLAVSEKLKEKIADDLKAIFKILVNELIDRAGIQVKEDAKNGTMAVSQLIEEFRQLAVTIDTRYGTDSEFSQEMRNQVAQACRNFSIAYGNATKDWEGCIKVLKRTREFITDPNLLAQLDSDFKVLTENQKLKDEAGRCWVCHGRSGVADHEIKMHGNERRDIVSNQVTWAVRSIKIPLCSKCKFKYYGLHLLVLPMSVGLGSLIGFIVGTIMDTSRHGQMGQDGACIGAFLGLGLAILLYWGGLIRWLWFRKYPAVLEAKRNGFSFGEWPSGIT